MIAGLSASSTGWSYLADREGRQGSRERAGESSPGAPPSAAAPEQAAEPKSDKVGEDDAPATTGQRGANGQPLTADQVQMISELQARDREVRAHEAAHKAVGGSLAGGMSFSYQTGPDGRRYAVGGEVSIDTGGGGNPQTTIANMRQVIAAALAPADPSSQDRAVAAGARAAMAAAQLQLSEQQRAPDPAEEKKPATDEPETKPPVTAARGYGQQPAPSGGLLSLIA